MDEQSSSWSSWLASGATSHHVRSPTPVPARASMDGWADSGCCAAFVAQHNKRKREAAAAAALAAQLSATQLAAYGAAAAAPQDTLGFG